MRHILTLVFFLTLFNVKAQYDCVIDFESNPCWASSCFIDTTNEGSIWDISVPNKTLFNCAYSLPKAILTDSTSPYPVNDTSSFIIKFVYDNYCMCAPCIAAKYKIDSDTLTDYGLIELSTDNGQTWYNLLSDTVISDMEWLLPKPVFTGKVNEWTEFLAILPINMVQFQDTVLYRFTFISDSVQTNREGWMLDDIALLIHTESTANKAVQNVISIYPNPTNEFLYVQYIELYQSKFLLKIYDTIGRKVFNELLKANTLNCFDVHCMENGIYYYEVTDDKEYIKYNGKFVINK